MAPGVTDVGVIVDGTGVSICIYGKRRENISKEVYGEMFAQVFEERYTYRNDAVT